MIVSVGACGFECAITVEALPGGRLKVDVQCDCEHVKEFAGEVSQLDECAALGPWGTNVIHQAAARSIPHAGCVVPCGVAKCVEVVAGAALPVNAELKFKESNG